MTPMTFIRYIDYEDGLLARMETESGIPFNVFVEPESDMDLVEGIACELEIGGVSEDFELYESKDEYYASKEHWLAAEAMIPAGTFPPHCGELGLDEPAHNAAGHNGSCIESNLGQTTHIIFTGKVEAVEWSPYETGDGPNLCLTIKTLDMEFKLYVRHFGDVEPDHIVSGTAWMFAIITAAAPQGRAS